MRRAVALLAVVPALLLAGCAPTVALSPAPQATSARCAGVVVRLPQTLVGLARRSTDAQGTAAWGDDPAITLVCGTTRTPSNRCGTVEGVDWTTANARIRGREVVVLTTYGRDPVVQVVKPARGAGETAQVSVNDVLREVTDAVRTATAATGRRCTAEPTS